MPHQFLKPQDTWTTVRSTNGPRFRTGPLSAASVGMASRKLSFSNCDLPSCFDKTESDTSSNPSIDDDGGKLEALRQDHENLQRLYDGKVEDLREKVAELDIAEDRVMKLEREIQTMKRNHSKSSEQLESAMAQTKLNLSHQNEALDEANEALRDHVNTISRLRKEEHDLKKELAESQAELTKTMNDLRTCQTQHLSLKEQLRNTQDVYEVVNAEESLKSLKLAEEYQRISAELNDLRESNKQLELQKCELEDCLAQNRSPPAAEVKKSNSFYDDSGDVEPMDNDTLLKTAFPPTSELSIFAEMQSAMLTLPKTFTDMSTQTENEEQPPPPRQEAADLDASDVESPQTSSQNTQTDAEGGDSNATGSQVKKPWWKRILRPFVRVVLTVFGLYVFSQLTAVPACTTSSPYDLFSFLDFAAGYPVRL